MYLTKQILDKYNACGPGVDWFERRFPNGAELIDIIKAPHIPASFLHWGRLHLTTNEDERRAYNEALHIINSTNYWSCSMIENCTMITNTNNAKNSKYIYDSANVSDSEDVTNSTIIEHSQKVFNSERIYASTDIAHSNNIKESENISYSTFVLNSRNVFQSSLITSSNVVLNSKNIEYSGFISNCSDLSHCLFCYDKNTGLYEIFNKPINEAQWKFIYDELKDMLQARRLNLFDTWDPEIIEHGNSCHIAQNIQFSTLLDEQMINWIKHLPYYDNEIVYKMTFHPSFLK